MIGVSSVTTTSSPSFRAVSRAAGAPYADRLLPLPPFLVRAEADAQPSVEDLRQALAITGYFLERHVAGPRGVPLSDARARLVALISA